MNTERSLKLRGRYHLLPIIIKLKADKWTNEKIADLLGCSISTVKYAVRHAADPEPIADDLSVFGKRSKEWLRVAAVYHCLEFLTIRGWQAAESDAKCVYDIFAIKDDKVIKIQVRSSAKYSKRGWPSFKTDRMIFNTKRSTRLNFVNGDFDFWFFYGSKQDAWMIPFEKIEAKREVSMEGYDKYYIG